MEFSSGNELYNFVKPTADGFKLPIVLVFNPELRYEQYVTTDNSLTKYYIKRVLRLMLMNYKEPISFVSDVDDTIDGAGEL